MCQEDDEWFFEHELGDDLAIRACNTADARTPGAQRYSDKIRETSPLLFKYDFKGVLDDSQVPSLDPDRVSDINHKWLSTMFIQWVHNVQDSTHWMYRRDVNPMFKFALNRPLLPASVLHDWLTNNGVNANFDEFSNSTGSVQKRSRRMLHGREGDGLRHVSALYKHQMPQGLGLSAAALSDYADGNLPDNFAAEEKPLSEHANADPPAVPQFPQLELELSGDVSGVIERYRSSQLSITDATSLVKEYMFGLAVNHDHILDMLKDLQLSPMDAAKSLLAYGAENNEKPAEWSHEGNGESSSNWPPGSPKQSRNTIPHTRLIRDTRTDLTEKYTDGLQGRISPSSGISMSRAALHKPNLPSAESAGVLDKYDVPSDLFFDSQEFDEKPFKRKKIRITLRMPPKPATKTAPSNSRCASPSSTSQSMEAHCETSSHGGVEHADRGDSPEIILQSSSIMHTVENSNHSSAPTSTAIARFDAEQNVTPVFEVDKHQGRNGVGSQFKTPLKPRGGRLMERPTPHLTKDDYGGVLQSESSWKERAGTPMAEHTIQQRYHEMQVSLSTGWADWEDAVDSAAGYPLQDMYDDENLSSSPEKGLSQDLWGLPMPTKEARSKAREINLPPDYVAKRIRSSTLRRHSAKLYTKAISTCTIPYLKRKPSATSSDHRPWKVIKQDDVYGPFAKGDETHKEFLYNRLRPYIPLTSVQEPAKPQYKRHTFMEKKTTPGYVQLSPHVASGSIADGECSLTPDSLNVKERCASVFDANDQDHLVSDHQVTANLSKNIECAQDNQTMVEPDHGLKYVENSGTVKRDEYSNSPSTESLQESTAVDSIHPKSVHNNPFKLLTGSYSASEPPAGSKVANGPSRVPTLRLQRSLRRETLMPTVDSLEIGQSLQEMDHDHGDTTSGPSRRNSSPLSSSIATTLGSPCSPDTKTRAAVEGGSGSRFDAQDRDIMYSIEPDVELLPISSQCSKDFGRDGKPGKDIGDTDHGQRDLSYPGSDASRSKTPKHVPDWAKWLKKPFRFEKLAEDSVIQIQDSREEESAIKDSLYEDFRVQSIRERKSFFVYLAEQRQKRTLANMAASPNRYFQATNSLFGNSGSSSALNKQFDKYRGNQYLCFMLS